MGLYGIRLSKMKIKWETKIDELPKLKATMAEIDGKKVSVGVRGENAWLAGIHEFGLKILITDKMRRYLASQGLYLRAETQYINIPERSFLRSGFDKNKDKIIRDVRKLVPLVAEGKISGDDLLGQTGEWLRGAIKEYAIDLKDPSNHPFTIKRKNSSNPLISTGDMVDHIEYMIE